MAIARSQVYECSVCGNVVEVIRVGSGTLVCCGVPMNLLAENTTDAAQEKHVPVIEKVDGGVRVKVGSVPHPMEENHHIEWIQISAGGKNCRQYLSPGEQPEAYFPVDAGEVVAREVCNLHGLWKGE